MRRYRLAILVTLIIGLAIGMQVLGWAAVISDGLVRGLAPVIRLIRGWQVNLATRQAAADCSTARALALAGERERPALLSAATATERLRDENAALRALLKYATPTTTVVAAAVIGQSFVTTEQTLIINQGKNADLEMGRAVTSPEGILIGKIIAVRPHTALVRLLQDHRSKISARLLNPERSRGVVEGGYGAGLKMKFIPRNETLKVGDLAVTAGLEAGIPPGLLIGTVAEIENEAYQPFQQAALAPITEASKLTLVGVLLP